MAISAPEKITKKMILEKIGNIAQLASIRKYFLADGPAMNMRAADIDTGGGLSLTVLPDRGMDISLASYKGINISYLTCTGEINPAFFEPEGVGWLRTYTAGLLTTCGLTYLGPPVKDGDEELGLHGRYSTIPVRQLSDNSRWEGDKYILELSGITEEARIFGDKIRLSRKISAIAGESRFFIDDNVENFGFSDSPFTILYHINIGFPFLDAHSKFSVSAHESYPRDPEAAKGLARKSEFSAPIPNFKEQVFTYRVKPDQEGFGRAELVNEMLEGGLKLYVKFNHDELPFLTQWKMAGQGEYVLGIEPCNVPCENRKSLRDKKMLPMLAPGETRKIHLEIGVEKISK